MREIKFRAWDKLCKIFFNNDEIGMIGGKVHKLKDDEWAYVKHDTVELMQYTALKDKNGVDIYEGDIVKGNYLRGIGTIVWSEVHARFQVDNRHTINQSDEFEVIGNIYENKELINDK